MSDTRRRIRGAAQYGVSLVLMGVFLYWAFGHVDAHEMWRALRGVSLFWVAMLVLTTLVSMTLRAWRWAVLVRPFAPQVTVRDATLALGICYAANMAIPRSGEALRAISLKWTRGAQLSATLATVVVERIIDLVWLVLLFAGATIVLRGRLEQAYPWLRPVSITALVASVLALVLLAVVSLRRERAAAWTGRVLSRVWPGGAPRTAALLETFLSGMTALHTPSAYLQLVISSVLLNAAYVAIIYEGFMAFDLARLYELGPGAALVIMVVASIGVILPTPGAVGSYHAFYSQALMHLYGVQQSQALASATAVHAAAALTYIMVGVPALLWQRRRRAEARLAATGSA